MIHPQREQLAAVKATFAGTATPNQAALTRAWLRALSQWDSTPVVAGDPYVTHVRIGQQEIYRELAYVLDTPIDLLAPDSGAEGGDDDT